MAADPSALESGDRTSIGANLFLERANGSRIRDALDLGEGLMRKGEFNGGRSSRHCIVISTDNGLFSQSQSRRLLLMISGTVD